MNVGIDIGNTRIKYYLFDHGKLEEKVFGYKDIPWKKINNIIVVRTGKPDKRLEKLLREQSEKVLYVSPGINLPFEILYESDTLGADRIALVAGAKLLYGNNILVIDAGTCITYDYLDAESKYLGGAISPGIEMRYRALHDYTAGLPLLKFDEKLPPLIGKRTDLSIHSGVIHGVLKEIEGLIVDYRKQYPGIKIVLTGGNAKFLSKSLKIKIFAIQKFLLAYGLKIISDLNRR